MSIKRIEEEDTGIYKRVVHTSGPNVEDIKQMLQATARAWDVDPRLKQLEADARAVLKDNGYTDWPMPTDLAGNAPIVRDADDVLWRIRCLRDAMERGNLNDSVVNALMLGRDAERMCVRPFEWPAKYGREHHFYWQGAWVKVTPLERRILSFMAGKQEAPLHTLVRSAWGERYRIDHRTRYDKALSQLNRKFLDCDPPIRTSFAVRGESVTVT